MMDIKDFRKLEKAMKKANFKKIKNMIEKEDNISASEQYKLMYKLCFSGKKNADTIVSYLIDQNFGLKGYTIESMNSEMEMDEFSYEPINNIINLNNVDLLKKAIDAGADYNAFSLKLYSGKTPEFSKMNEFIDALAVADKRKENIVEGSEPKRVHQPALEESSEAIA